MIIERKMDETRRSIIPQTELDARSKFALIQGKPNILHCEKCNIYLSITGSINKFNASEHLQSGNHLKCLNGEKIDLVPSQIRKNASYHTVVFHIDKSYKTQSFWCRICNKRITGSVFRFNEHMKTESHQKGSNKLDADKSFITKHEELLNIDNSIAHCKACNINLQFRNMYRHCEKNIDHKAIMRNYLEIKSNPQYQASSVDRRFSLARSMKKDNKFNRVFDGMESDGIKAMQNNGKYQVYCEKCDAFYDWRSKNNALDHVKSAKHRNNTKCLNGHTPNEFFEATNMLFTAMGWPISAVDKLIFKNFIKKFLGIQFPSSSSIEKKYSEKLTKQCLSHIQNNYEKDSIWIGYDETTDPVGRRIGGITVGSMTDPSKPVMLADYHELKDGKAHMMADAVINSIESLFTYESQDSINERTLCFMTDAASAMIALLKELRKRRWFIKAIHITCGAHKLHNLASKIKDKFKILNEAMMSAKRLFIKSPRRRQFFREHGFLIPPKPNHIRWGIWLKCVLFYVNESNIQSLIAGLTALKDFEKTAEVKDEVEKLSTFFETNYDRIITDARTVNQFFGMIPSYIKRMENRSTTMDEIFSMFQSVEDSIREMPTSAEQRSISKYFNDIMGKYSGFKAVKKVREEGITSSAFNRWSEDDWPIFKNLPFANDEIERVFSVVKAFYRSNRRRFNFGNLRDKIVANNVLNKLGGAVFPIEIEIELPDQENSDPVETEFMDIPAEYFYGDAIDETDF